MDLASGRCILACFCAAKHPLSHTDLKRMFRIPGHIRREDQKPRQSQNWPPLTPARSPRLETVTQKSRPTSLRKRQRPARQNVKPSHGTHMMLRMPYMAHGASALGLFTPKNKPLQGRFKSGADIPTRCKRLQSILKQATPALSRLTSSLAQPMPCPCA